MARKKTSKKTAGPKPAPLRFDQRLVLNRYILSLFNVSTLEQLSKGLKDRDSQGRDENNISQYFYKIIEKLPSGAELTRDVLLQYDENIHRHTEEISSGRTVPVKWLYFQYLALLFTEIYLDLYFRDPDGLLYQLNVFLSDFNRDKEENSQATTYTADDLKKLAFWSATGSGKTFIMHINILQYLHYLQLHGREKELNRIILLTIDEGLSQQHREDFDASKLQADFFAKGKGRRISSRFIEIIEISKLKEEGKEKTVSVDAFEGNNLVLVDEGHRGSSGDIWKAMRDKLCKNGFSFEYSATFGQAVKASGKNELLQEYAKCILFDYSYKYFHKDGYGKDYNILNLASDRDEVVRRRYLTACLLAFYQQQRLFLDKEKNLAVFLLEKPLLVFVGGSVKAVRTENKRKVSDVVDVLLFIAAFVKEEETTIRIINQLLTDKPDLLDEQKRDIFKDKFTYLYQKGNNEKFTGKEIYLDILQTIFNCDTPRADLHLDNLKGIKGEIGLRLGDNEYFGVINVGDDIDLLKLCEKEGFHVSSREFARSLFQDIKDQHSMVNILIGSKKFTTGWSCWRVSTMGLLNIGRSEGSEIIQLFGRGVRLKGHNFCLKRSKELPDVSAPEYVHLLETLNVFGVRSEYMRQFQDYMEEEGATKDSDWLPITLPVINNLGKRKLKILKLKEGCDFKKQAPNPVLELPDHYLIKNKVVVDWYPRVQAMYSGVAKAGAGLQSGEMVLLNQGYLEDKHLALIDWNNVYFELVRYKNEKGWYNLNISRRVIQEIFSQKDWYILYIPKKDLDFTDFGQLLRWQEIVVALLKKYCERFYNARRAGFESDKLEYAYLDEYEAALKQANKSGNMLDEYKVSVKKSEEDIILKINELKKHIEKGSLKDWTFKNITAISFDQHLYKPIIYLDGDEVIKISPVALKDSEKDFVVSLRNYLSTQTSFFVGKELYLLRNQSRGRGIGFFEAHNFHPDFILWLVVDDLQYVTFIDPKGLRNTPGENDVKINFYKTVKNFEKQMGDSQVVLNSFIVTPTLYSSIYWWNGGMTKDAFAEKHVFFMKEDKNYLKSVFEMILKRM